jgi:hypothetical protein
MATLTEDLQSYHRLVRSLDEEYADPNVLVILGLREEIEWDLTLLGREQTSRLEKDDATLAAKWQIVAEMLPMAGRSNRSHWWWFLHEGPQVNAPAQERVPA